MGTAVLGEGGLAASTGVGEQGCAPTNGVVRFADFLLVGFDILAGLCAVVADAGVETCRVLGEERVESQLVLLELADPRVGDACGIVVGTALYMDHGNVGLEKRGSVVGLLEEAVLVGGRVAAILLRDDLQVVDAISGSCPAGDGRRSRRGLGGGHDCRPQSRERAGGRSRGGECHVGIVRFSKCKI